MPTRIGKAADVMRPVDTSDELPPTSMKGEQRVRLTERCLNP